MPDLGLCVRGRGACALLRLASFDVPARRLGRDDLGVGILPVPVFDLLDCLGYIGWSFHSNFRRRHRRRQACFSLHAGAGQRQSVGLCQFVRHGRRLDVAFTGCRCGGRRGERPSRPDRDRGAQTSQAKKGEPDRPRHSQWKGSCSVDKTRSQSSRPNSGESVRPDLVSCHVSHSFDPNAG
jgi:hypothetical protein